MSPPVVYICGTTATVSHLGRRPEKGRNNIVLGAAFVPGPEQEALTGQRRPRHNVGTDRLADDA